MPVYYIYCLAWFGLMIIAILNGVVRVIGLQKFLPELRAHQVSCFTGILFFGIAVYLLNNFWPVESGKQAILIGFTWLVVTILFEFGFGHYIMNNSWEKLFNDYRIDQGRLWILVLLWTAVVPYVVYSIRQTQS
jgi:hypothetical protein